MNNLFQDLNTPIIREIYSLQADLILTSSSFKPIYFVLSLHTLLKSLYNTPLYFERLQEVLHEAFSSPGLATPDLLIFLTGEMF